MALKRQCTQKTKIHTSKHRFQNKTLKILEKLKHVTEFLQLMLHMHTHTHTHTHPKNVRTQIHNSENCQSMIEVSRFLHPASIPCQTSHLGIKYANPLPCCPSKQL